MEEFFERLNEFHKKFPNIHIKVTNGTSLQCVDYLDSNQVDLIITNSPNIKLKLQFSNSNNFNDILDEFVINELTSQFNNISIFNENTLDYQKF